MKKNSNSIDKDIQRKPKDHFENWHQTFAKDYEQW